MTLTRRQLMAIENDKPFLARLFWEYRQQCLDLCEAMLELGIRSTDSRYEAMIDAAKDAAFIAWHYGADVNGG